MASEGESSDVVVILQDGRQWCVDGTAYFVQRKNVVQRDTKRKQDAHERNVAKRVKVRPCLGTVAFDTENGKAVAQETESESG